jgi:hypothetical protein
MDIVAEQHSFTKPIFENIPTSLQEANRWVVWTIDVREGKPTKVPLKPNNFNPDDPQQASCSRPQEWASFGTAKRIFDYAQRMPVAKPIFGVGRMLDPGDNLVGIDLDKCRNKETGEIAADACEVLALLNSYAEVSPSGTGLRIVIRGTRPDNSQYYIKNVHNHFECYGESRYLTFTGDRLPRYPAEPQERQAELDQFLNRWMRKPAGETTNNSKPGGSVLSGGVTIEQVRQRLLAEGYRWHKVWNGDLTAYSGDQSAADLALCSKLAFYCGRNPKDMDLVFRSSGLMRQKWEREDYRQGTINKAIQSCDAIFDWQRSADRSYKFAPMDSAAFAQAEYQLEWLVRGVLVKGQPCILGGPRKSLKTNILVDLAVSLGSGTPFLGMFPTGRIRTILISGESGDYTIQETARRICAAKAVPMESLDTLWDFRLPRLSVADELSELGRGLKEHGIEAAIIDPLYLCLLSGGQADAKNLFDMGPLLLDVATACQRAGCTPILAHHARKNRNNPDEPMDLDDLAFAGVAEFARQWILLCRREPYDAETGTSKLFLTYGGSAGHGGLKALDISEGTIDGDFAGRKWEVSLRSLDELKAIKTAERAAKDERQNEQLEAELLAVINKTAPATLNKIRNYLGWGGPKTERILARLVEKGCLTGGTEAVLLGNGAMRNTLVYRTSGHADGTSAGPDESMLSSTLQ